MTRNPRTRSGDSSGTGSTASTPWYRRRVGMLIVFGYSCLTAAGILVSMGFGGFIGAEHTVPPRMYLYVVIGVTGYVFTTLVVDVDRSVPELVKVGIRIPASLTLGLGVFLLASLVGPQGVGTSRVVAGFAFLTGLYTNMTYKGLGALAERLYWGRGGRDGSRQGQRGRGTGRGRRRRGGWRRPPGRGGGRGRGRRRGDGGRGATPPVPLSDREATGGGDPADSSRDASDGTGASGDASDVSDGSGDASGGTDPSGDASDGTDGSNPE